MRNGSEVIKPASCGGGGGEDPTRLLVQQEQISRKNADSRVSCQNGDTCKVPKTLKVEHAISKCKLVNKMSHPHGDKWQLAARQLPICLILLMAMAHQTAGALFSNAQYSQVASCDSARLIRCQQDVLRDLQTVSLNSASIQYPMNGPPYSPSKQQLQQQQQQLVNPTTCRLVRSNLDCLLITTPACYDQGYQTAQNTDIILRAKRFLEQNNCNEPDVSWQSTLCYRSPEMRSCEERYGFTSFLTGSLATANVSNCLSYHAFKSCAETHLRYNCKVHEMDMANEYLIDRASDLAWRCPLNSTVAAHSANYANNPYQLNNYQSSGGSLLSPSVSSYSGNLGGAYDQRPIPTYVGSQGGSVNLFAGVRDQPWERFRNPSDDTRFGISRYPGSLGGAGVGAGDVFDRLVAGNSFDPDSSDCPIKAAPYARECEDTLLEQQRLARDSRDGNELQRRVCWDCVSRVVLDRCADSSPTAVEILMGNKRREMTITCRGFNRDICSGALAQAILSLPTLVAIVVLATLHTFKHSSLSNHIAL